VCGREGLRLEHGLRTVSFAEALKLTAATGWALAGMLAVFAECAHGILHDRIKAGIAQGQGREASQATAHRPGAYR
jgi:hypothetical protein